MVIKGSYCVINGQLKPAAEFKEAFIVNGQSVYEVIRVKNQKPLFLDLHLNRMARSVQLTGIICPDAQNIRAGIHELIEKSVQNEGNIELVINNSKNWSARFIPHNFPTGKDYEKGVKTLIYRATRQNPNAKVKLNDLRKKVGDFISKKSIYEVIYAHDGIITEGSRSNIFFIKNNQFYTPPQSQVLQGITRHVVLEILKKHNYPIIEEPVKVDGIDQYDAAFLTGTSPGVLPIASIDGLQFNTQIKVMRSIMYLFEQCMNQDCA